MKIGFVICSRVDSKRVPRKVFTPLAGTPLIEHLISRCIDAGFPVYLAIPGRDYDQYKYLKEIFPDNFFIYLGQTSDPLARMTNVVNKFELDAAIRVSHDKVFIEKELVRSAVEEFQNGKLDYVYSSSLPAGASFEIISKDILNRASAKYKDVEHISYAIKATADPNKIRDFETPSIYRMNHRLLIDYPEDVRVLDMVLSQMNPHCSLLSAINFLDTRPWITRMNQPPKITVYTCAYNAGKWIQKAMGSVAQQQGFQDIEYIIIDDFSSDRTAVLVSKFADLYQNVKWYRNPQNLGLASSSNIALTHARGQYILRLDADDYFFKNDAINCLIQRIEETGADAIYPANYFGDFRKIQKGSEAHHVGGTIFRTRAANYVKFTEGLRGYEGLDFFVRAQGQIKIDYLDKPIFFYRQHKNSMSKTNLEERARLKDHIFARAT